MASKEQLKLRATFLNSVAASSVVASVITPGVGLSIGAIQWASDRLWIISSACAFWFVIAVLLHVIAYRLVAGLE